MEDELGELVDGPYEHNRVVDTYWWVRPNGAGDLGYNRLNILRRCVRIFGGHVKIIRMVDHSVTTVHHDHPDSL